MAVVWWVHTAVGAGLILIISLCLKERNHEVIGQLVFFKGLNWVLEFGGTPTVRPKNTKKKPTGHDNACNHGV